MMKNLSIIVVIFSINYVGRENKGYSNIGVQLFCKKKESIKALLGCFKSLIRSYFSLKAE